MWSDWLDGIKLFVWTALVLVLGATVGLVGSGAIDFGWSPAGGREAPGDARQPMAETRGLSSGDGERPLGQRIGDSSGRGSEGLGRLGDFSGVARAVGPGVVSIEVRRRFEHPPLPEASESTFPDGEFDIPSSGSGFLYDRDGHVLTNYHVVSGARRVWVHLADGRTLDAEVVGTDSETDVAVLRVTPAQELPTLRLGKAADLAIGDWVAAVGNPLGYLDGTFTVGVVSGKGRSEVLIRGGSPSYQDFIQTDAAINFGNSGGPLVNRSGEVVGINTAFGGQGSGIGFAIPIELAREVAESLVQSGHVRRAYLGVLLQEIDLDLARALGLPTANGILIREVYPDTPASSAGLQPGDAILEIDGEPVQDVAGFRLQVAHSRIGEAVHLVGQRWGETVALDVILAPRETQVGEEESPAAIVHPAGMGLEVEALSDSLRKAGETGVRVRSVDPDSWAADAGLEEGDQILQADGKELIAERDFARILGLARSERRPLVLALRRGGIRWFAAIPTETPGSGG